MTNTQVNVFKSRWGFHPVNGDDHAKIKLLHKHYWKAKTAKAAKDRYMAKEPQNRVIRKQNKIVLSKPIPMPVPFYPPIYIQLVTKDIVTLYHSSRLPVTSPELVKPLSIPMPSC